MHLVFLKHVPIYSPDHECDATVLFCRAIMGVNVEEIQEEFADLDIDITDDEVLLKLKVTN